MSAPIAGHCCSGAAGAGTSGLGALVLFEISPMGMTVVIASEATEPERVDHPGYLAPVSFEGGDALAHDPLAPGEIERWQPELSPSGPVSSVLSQGSRRVLVYRNGIEIGRARMTISGDEPITSHALVLTEGPSSTSDPYVPDPTKFRWVLIGVPGQTQQACTQVTAAVLARIKLPPEFVGQVNSILRPGATVFVTNEALSPQSSGPILRVVDADPPSGTSRS
jgi:hypothetical protein